MLMIIAGSSRTIGGPKGPLEGGPETHGRNPSKKATGKNRPLCGWGHRVLTRGPGG